MVIVTVLLLVLVNKDVNTVAVLLGIAVAVATLVGLIWRVASRGERLLEEIRDNTKDIAFLKMNQVAMEGRLIAKTQQEAVDIRGKLAEVKDIVDK